MDSGKKLQKKRIILLKTSLGITIFALAISHSNLIGDTHWLKTNLNNYSFKYCVDYQRENNLNYSFKWFGFKIINCTFATPLLGMECLIKNYYCELIKLQDNVS